MKLKALKRYPIKKGMPVEEQELELAAGVGIVGDCHADGGVRQISLLTTEQKDWMQQQEVKGFCFSKFKENILLETETELQVGDRLQLGEAVIELTENRKVCHEDLCGMAKKDIPCLLSGGCLFAAVLESGVIRMDSPVSLKKQAPSMAEWLKEAKADASAAQIGMYLTHNGIVRQTARAKVRDGQTDAQDVQGMWFDYDEAKVQAAVEETYKLPGIYYIRTWLNRGQLEVGDDIMYVLIGGDIRPHVMQGLDFLVDKLKKECVSEKEIV